MNTDTYFFAPDGDDEPTLWGGEPAVALLQRCERPEVYDLLVSAAELRAAIEALCDDLELVARQPGTDELARDIYRGTTDRLRALVADGGAGVLREHDERVRRELMTRLWAHIEAYRWHNVCLTSRYDDLEEDVVAVPDLEEFIHPHRDTAGEAGDAD